ncbi:MAG: transcriptional regulator [Hyphomicrobiaceae bacterium]|nr:MAG: transcriptional regulator [Hyphomicrobiaceae bacterium]
MTISHHLDDATLMSFAAGTLPAALAVVAASHIAACPLCRTALVHAERIGAALMDDLPPATITGASPPMPDGSRRAVPPHAPAAGPPQPANSVPPPLARLIGNGLDAIRWRPLAIGVWHHRIALDRGGAGDLRLLKLAPGRGVPEHGHNGMELTLVLRGSYHDAIGTFCAGDVADLDDAVEHQPISDAAQGCVCVVASEKPARFRGWLPRILAPFHGL